MSLITLKILHIKTISAIVSAKRVIHMQNSTTNMAGKGWRYKTCAATDQDRHLKGEKRRHQDKGCRTCLGGGGIVGVQKLIVLAEHIVETATDINDRDGVKQSMTSVSISGRQFHPREVAVRVSHYSPTVSISPACDDTAIGKYQISDLPCPPGWGSKKG